MEREKKQFFLKFSTHVTTRRPTPPTDVTARVSFSLVSNMVAVASLLLISRKKGASNVDDAAHVTPFLDTDNCKSFFYFQYSL